MKNEIVKPIIKIGNSAGVILPKNWINGEARVELIARPLNIKRDIFDILREHLPDIIGIYLTGSYARGEQEERSDVDVLAITNRTSKRVKRGKYDILLITKKDVDDTIKNNALPLIPMLKEAKAIINEGYLKSVKGQQISKKNLQWNISMIKSALNINKELIELKKEYSEYAGDSVAYSIILNLRSLYLIECIKKKQKWSNKEFLSLVKDVSGSSEAYEGYLRVKNNEKIKGIFPVPSAERLLDYAYKKLTEQERWIKRKD